MHVLGALFALALFAPLGAGMLMLLGAWRIADGVLRVGLVVFTGLATGAVLLPWVLYLGGNVALGWALAIGMVATIAGLIRLPRIEPGHTFVHLDPIGLLAIALPTVVLAVDAVPRRVDTYDAFANWMLKAKLIWADGGLPHWAFAQASAAPPLSRQFPLGLPALEAAVLHGTRGDFGAAQLLFVALPAGLACVVWAMLRPHVDPWVLAAGVSLLLWMPALRAQAPTDYADVPLACFFVAAVLCIGSRQLPLGAVFAAAALATKRDAIAACLVLAVLAAVRWPRRRMLIAIVAVALTTVPWRVWVATHDLHDADVGTSPSRFADNAHQAGWVAGRLGEILLRWDYAWAVPIAALAAVVLLFRRDGRELATGVLVLGLGLVAALVLVYLNGHAGVHYLVRTSAKRTLLPTAILAAAVLPLLVWRVVRPRAA
jgi:hypothetical protein